MNDATINTIMTMVVRMKETVILTIPGEYKDVHQYIEWSKIAAEPQLVIPSMSGHPYKVGIAGCVLHLAGLPDETTYHIYKPQVDTQA